MKRRTIIKGILAFGVIGTSGISILKWFDINKTPDIKLLLSKKHLIADLAEAIIPATDTPGAKDAGVDDFILKIMLNCTDTRNQNIFIEGLSAIEDYSKGNFGKLFEHCDTKEKTQILAHFANKANRSIRLIGKVEKKFFGEPFFAKLKYLTVLGYFTSKPGAEQALVYDFIPGHFESCIKLYPGQKSWATS